MFADGGDPQLAHFLEKAWALGLMHARIGRSLERLARAVGFRDIWREPSIRSIADSLDRAARFGADRPHAMVPRHMLWAALPLARRHVPVEQNGLRSRADLDWQHRQASVQARQLRRHAWIY